MIRHIFIVIFFFISGLFRGYATHIVGGDFECNFLRVNELGQSVFEIKLTLYRDCSPDSDRHPYFSDPLKKLGIFVRNTNVLFDSITISKPLITKLFYAVRCFSPDTLCIDKGIYIKEIVLPDNPNGYYFVWEHGWRNKRIINIVKPLESGIVFYCEIPDPKLHNSTPRFKNDLIKYMCLDELFQYNFNGFDADGDSLVFKMDTPLAGISDPVTTGAYPSPSPVPHKTITWQTGYNLSNAMGGSPPLSIDINSGLLTARPDSEGVFVFAIRMEEYRNGVMIGVNRREVQFMVLKCPYRNPPIIRTEPPLTSLDLFLNETKSFDVITTDSLNEHDTMRLEAKGNGFDLKKTSGLNFKDTTGMAPLHSLFSAQGLCSNLTPGTYSVTFWGYNNGCPELMYDSLQVIVHIKEKSEEAFQQDFTNVFTPNGDGVNDNLDLSLFIKSKCSESIIGFEIFNRWGMEIYSSTDNPGNSWNGGPFPSGVYYFIIHTSAGKKAGWITLIR